MIGVAGKIGDGAVSGWRNDTFVDSTDVHLTADNLLECRTRLGILLRVRSSNSKLYFVLPLFAGMAESACSTFGALSFGEDGGGTATVVGAGGFVG